MANYIFLSWEHEMRPLSAPTVHTSTQYVHANADGLTSTVFTGTDFTYDGSFVPTGGTITSMSLVVNSDATVLQTVTNLAIGLADIGAFINDILDFRSQIDWFGVIDPNPQPLIFTPTQVRLANADGSFTDFLGTDFALTGDAPTGTVTSIQHVAADGNTVIETVSVNVSLLFGATALFDDVAGQQFYQLTGTGDNTLQGFTPFVTDTNFVYTNLESTVGHDTIIGEPLSTGNPEDGNRPIANWVDYDHAPSAITVDLAAGTVTGGHGPDTLITAPGVGGTQYDDTLLGNDANNGFNGSGGNDDIYGFGGDDLLQGGHGDDYIDGGAGSDTAQYYALQEDPAIGVAVSLAISGPQDTGGAGVDTLISIENLTGSQYADTLEGDGGANALFGGPGSDFLYGGGGNDNVSGDAGIDALFGGTGDDTMFGGDDGDSLDGEDGNDTLSGGGGVDWLYGGLGADTLNGDDGTDALFGQDGDDIMNGGAGDDALDGGAGNDNMSGGAGVDWLYGRDGIDFMSGDGETDALFGEDGNDTLNGGAGGDSLDGGFGDDVLNGDAGVDWLFGSFGSDTLNGGSETDALFGQEGNDILHGGADGDSLDGGADDDLIFGDDGVDWLFGQDDNDTLDGGNDGDVLFAGAGTDILKGGAGGDSLDGGTGNDMLDGGAGIDVLWGDAGADTFFFAQPSDGGDVVRDFVSGTDKIGVDHTGFGLGFTGALPGNMFETGSGLPASFVASGPVFYFDTAGHGLWFDPTGGSSVDVTIVAGFETGAPTVNDFVIS